MGGEKLLNGVRNSCQVSGLLFAVGISGRGCAWPGVGARVWREDGGQWEASAVSLLAVLCGVWCRQGILL